MAPKIVYAEVNADMKSGKDALTAEEAKALLGYRVPTTGEDFKTEFVFRDLEKNKVRLENNPSNRPFRMSLAKRYMSDMLRGKWSLNGETIVIDRHGFVQSGQHRLVALVMADQEYRRHPKVCAERYGLKSAPSLDTILITGISEKREVVDTLDMGQKRSLGDVIYRRDEFDAPDKDARKLSNTLSSAIRLVWIRTGGKVVSDAPHFPHSEALEFLDAHPRIKDAVNFIANEEGGSGSEGKRISGYLSAAYAAGFYYLMMTSGTKVDAEEPNFDREEKAQEFWVSFASGVGLEAKSPILTLRNALVKLQGSGGRDRDIICGMIAKAWNAFIEGKGLDAKDIRIREAKNANTGKMELAEFPRVGGLDIDHEPKVLESVEGWAINDACWVVDKNTGAWQGKIEGFHDADTAIVFSADDKESYYIPVGELKTDKPAEPKPDKAKTAPSPAPEASSNGHAPAKTGKGKKGKGQPVTA